MLKSIKIYLTKKIILVSLLLLVPSVYYLLTPGFYEPHDLHHFADIYEMYRALASGQLPPRLGPDFSWEYGYPLFNFYYVLPFYIGAFWFWLTGSLISAYKFVFLVTVALSFSGMYLFLRYFFGKLASYAGAVLFTYTPYKAVQIYVRGAMGEALALAILPFVFWGIKRLTKNPNLKNVAIFSIILALFLLSHNYLWLLSLAFIGAFTILELLRLEERKKSVIYLSTSVLLGGGLSCYWWLPAIMEKNIFPSTTPFLLEDHFPFIKQLIIPSWGYGASVWGQGDGISFQIGVVNLVLVAITVFIYLLRRKSLKDKKIRNLVLLSLAGFFVGIFFMNIRSLNLWKLLPIYQMVQFPWRLLFLTTFFTSILAAFVIKSLPKILKLGGALFIILFSIGLTFSYFKPSKVTNKTNDEYLKTFFAREEIEGKSGEVSEKYLTYSEDYLLMPDWIKERPNSLPDSKIETDAKVLSMSKSSEIDWKAEIEADESTDVVFNAHYFPGWYASVDGVGTEIQPVEPYGQISVDIDSGVHEVRFFWKETPLRKFADYVSLFSVLGVVFLAFKEIFYFKRLRSAS